MSYAAGTSVSVEKTRAELERLLAKHGASSRLMGSDDALGIAFVVFTLSGRQVRLKIPLPKTDEKRFVFDHNHHRRSPEGIRVKHEQACRERWRAMLLLVKAKLETIAIGLSTVEREFLADVYLPDGRTIHEAIMGDIERSYMTGQMPPLLGPAAAPGPIDGEVIEP